MTELSTLIHDLEQGRVWVEALVLLACVGLSWLSARLLRGNAPQESVWFGRHTVDGLLFPLLSAVLVYSAREVVVHYQPLALLKVALPILTSLATIRLFVRVLRSSFPESPSAQLIESVFSWMAWGVAVLWITGLLPAVLTELEDIQVNFGKTHISLRTIIEGTLTSSAVLVVVLWISATIEKRVLTEAVDDLSMRKVAANAIRAILLLLGLLFALSTVGVDLTALSVLGGALGVGLGFGLQKLAANYVSGFVILIERSLRIGDLVRVDGFEGVVTDIKTRYTLIRALNGRESVVPNELIITQRVENFTADDPKVAVTITVSVGYDSDVEVVRRVLLESAAACPRALQTPEPSAYLTDFGADGLVFALVFWIVNPQTGQMALRSEVNLAILAGLRAQGIDIPYPQRVVHVKKS